MVGLLVGLFGWLSPQGAYIDYGSRLMDYNHGCFFFLSGNNVHGEKDGAGVFCLFLLLRVVAATVVVVIVFCYRVADLP